MSESPNQLLADRKSFSILVRQHHRELLVYARALTGEADSAQDIVQEAFVSAYRKIEEFDLSRDFGAWVRGFVRNKYREWARRQKREPLGENEIGEMESVVAEWQSARIASGSGVLEALESCLKSLPATLRAAIDIFYLKETGGADAARELGISEASLRKRLERARTGLRDCIGRKTTQATTTSSSHA